MRPLLGGLVGGLFVFGLFFYGKKLELDRRAAQLEAGFRGQGSGTQMLLELQGRTMERDLQLYAEAQAQRAAQETMANVYGLTPSVVAALRRLSARLPSL
jgi:hypothetical protein